MTTDAQVSWTLSGFGDEIDPDPRVQIAVLKALGAQHIEVRSAWGVNVVDLSDEQLAELASLLKDAGLGVSAVASPIGKVDISLDPELEVRRLQRIIRVAHALETPNIRIFSFFRGEGVPVESTRDAVMTGLRLLADEAEKERVTLLHENEKDIYGDTPERVLDLVETVASPALRLAWDSANFVQVGVAHPHDDGYAKLRPYLDYLQVKDAVAATGEVVPARATVRCCRPCRRSPPTATPASRRSNRISRRRTRSAASPVLSRSARRPVRSPRCWPKPE